jgi:Zn-dependent protease/CBS domain-containing protein
MSWSFKIGRFFGIDVFVHATFLLLLAWVVGAAYFQTHSWAVAFDQLVFVILAFTIIVLHEYGHALTARRFGVPTRDITLLPIGGVARLERIPENPSQELLIAIAGPAVNVVLAVLCFAWMMIDGTLAAWMQHAMAPKANADLMEALVASSLSLRLFTFNVFIVLFNLIPAFPMDGGRVLRALLAMVMDYVQATQIAASVGQFVALLFGFAGLFGNPLLIFIALFVWIGAASESGAVAQRSMLAGITVRRAMVSKFATVNPYDTLEVVAQHVLDGFQEDFPVLHGDQVVGMITRKDLLTALASLGRQGHVSEVMQREFLIARPEEMLTDVIARLQQCACHSLPVLEGERLVGIITSENIGEFMMIRSAVEQSAQQ